MSYVTSVLEVKMSVRSIAVGIAAFFIVLSTLSLALAVVCLLLLRPILFILCIIGFLSFLCDAFLVVLVWAIGSVLIHFLEE
jgi:hypothetical protein